MAFGVFTLVLRRLPLILSLAAAITLRFGAINWGAPFLYHPDEHLILQPAMSMVRDHTANPHWFQYPSLLLYVEAGVVAVLRPFIAAPLATDPLVNQIGPWDALPAQWPFVLGGRIAVALCALLGVWCVYRTGRSYSGGPAGVGAALLLVAAPLHNESSHFLTTDVPAATLLAAALALSVAGARAADLRRLAAAGFVAGLAAGTKYTAGIALFVPLVAAMSGSPRRAAQRMLIVVAVAAAGFLAACPFAILGFSEFWGGLQQQRQNYLGDNVPGSDWRWYIRYLADTGLLRPSAVACALGLAGMLLRGILPQRSVGKLGTSVPPRSPGNEFPGSVAPSRLKPTANTDLGVPLRLSNDSAGEFIPRRVNLALVLVPLAYFAFLSWYPYRAQRNLVILLPFLCVAGADVSWRLLRRFGHRRAIAAYTVLMCGLAAPGFLACVQHDRQLGQPDTRTVALGWIEANLPAGSRIAREEYTPQVPAPRYLVSYEWSLALRSYGWYLEQQVDYLVVSSSVYARAMHPPYVAGPPGRSFYEFVFRNLPLTAEFQPGADRSGPVIRIYRVPHA